MAKIKDHNFNVDLQIKNADLLNCSLVTPKDFVKPWETFHFDIALESNADPKQKLILVNTHVSIKGDAYPQPIASVLVRCVFELMNFEEVVTISPEEKFDIPPGLVDVLNSISLSTTRGIMASCFRGTSVHGALLPILDPKQFRKDPTPAL